MTEFLSKTSNEAANINECENLNDNSNLFTIVVENVYLNQIHYLNDINILTHFHNLLINYCKSHGMDLTSFVFLVPSDDSSTRNISWRVATPSMRVKDAILEYLFDVKERRIFIQCVLKKDVSKYVAWNNCDSKKYTKVSTNAVKSVIYPSAPTPKRKRRAPLPPPVPIHRHLYGNTSKESQFSRQDSSVDTNLDHTIKKSTSDLSQKNSAWSLSDSQGLSSALSTINIHAMEEYQDESSISEQFFILKPLEKPNKDDHDANSLSTECRITPESFSAISINETVQQNVNFNTFEEEHFEDNNYNRGFEPEMIKPMLIPTVGATINTTVKKPIENPVISPLLKTSPSTFASFHVPNFERESLKSRSSKLSEEGSKASLTDDSLQQAKAALKTVHQQKVASVPLRKADVEHLPSFLTSCDRAREKDWNGRFWCADNRSRILSFIISEERKF